MHDDSMKFGVELMIGRLPIWSGDRIRGASLWNPRALRAREGEGRALKGGPGRLRVEAPNRETASGLEMLVSNIHVVTSG